DGERFPVLIEDLNPVVAAIADEYASLRINRDGVQRPEFAGRPAGLAPFFEVLSVFRELHHAVIPVVVVTIGDEDVAVLCDRDVARRIEVIGPAARLAWNSERHQDLSVGTELDAL